MASPAGTSFRGAVGRYESIGQDVGVGGEGACELVRDTKTGANMVLKRYHAPVPQDTPEAQRLTTIVCQRPLAISGLAQPVDLLFEKGAIVGELSPFAPGDDLRTWLAGVSPKRLGTRITVALQLLRTLSACHARGVTLGDLHDGQMKLGDGPTMFDVGSIAAAGLPAPTNGFGVRDDARAPEFTYDKAPSEASDVYGISIPIHMILSAGLHPLRNWQSGRIVLVGGYQADPANANAGAIEATRAIDLRRYGPEIVNAFRMIYGPANTRPTCAELISVFEQAAHQLYECPTCRGEYVVGPTRARASACPLCGFQLPPVQLVTPTGQVLCEVKPGALEQPFGGVPLPSQLLCLTSLPGGLLIRPYATARAVRVCASSGVRTSLAPAQRGVAVIGDVIEVTAGSTSVPLTILEKI